MWRRAVLFCVLAICSPVSAAQLLPPPKDGDIRDAYWELRNESETWLSLELKTADGRPAPFLTFTHTYPGKPPGPPAAQVEVRAYGRAPFAELVFVLDDKQTIDLSPPGGGLTSGTPSDYARATMTSDVLQQMAKATRITGRALGVGFQLTDSQRKAIATFHARITGAGR